ncbi:MAG: OmpA family protein [Alphaproteobacteria bacterium]
MAVSLLEGNPPSAGERLDSTETALKNAVEGSAKPGALAKIGEAPDEVAGAAKVDLAAVPLSPQEPTGAAALSNTATAETTAGARETGAAPPVSARPVAAPCVRKLSELARRSVIYFPRSRVSVSAEQVTLLSALIDMAQACPTARIEIMGHTDSVGAEATNLTLSWQRAEGVATLFTKDGIDRARLRVIGFGGKRPLVENETDSGQAVNRRVDFAVTEMPIP